MSNHHYIDLSGKTFGRWYVLERTPNVHPGASTWKCQCECGNIKDAVLYTSLIRGRSNSCGCLRSDMLMKPDHEVHSQRNSTYRIWLSMKTRCRNANHPSFKHYGAKGINCCDEWFNSFDVFLADMGARPEGMSLNRINNLEGYCKGNCRWSTSCQQAGNTRRNIKVIWNCMEVNLIDVARQENVDYPILRRHIYNGKKIEIAVSALKSKGQAFHERAVSMGGNGEPKSGKRRRTNKPAELPKIDKRYKHFGLNGGEASHPQDEPAAVPPPKGKPCMSHKQRAENMRRWKNHGWCIARGVQYRGPEPFDWNPAIHTRFPAGVKEKETHFKRKPATPA